MSSTRPGDGTPTAEENSDSPPSPAPSRSGPGVSSADVRDLARLRRTSFDRKVAGVAGGIARHLDIDPVVVRVAFVVLALFGGGGLLLYAACWLVVPDERSERAVLNLDGRTRAGVVVAAGALAALALVGDSLAGFGFPWPLAIVTAVAIVVLAVRQGTSAPETTGASEPGEAPPLGEAPPSPWPPAPLASPRPLDPRRRGPVWFWFTLGLSALGAGVVLALQLGGLNLPYTTYGVVVMAACGVMLLVGAFYGRAGGLVPLGLLAAVLTAALSATASLPGAMVSVGQTQVSPEKLSDLDRGYAVGFGEIKIDLTDTEIDGDHELDLDVGVGHIQVLVPEEGLAVEIDADVGIGEIRVFEDRYSDVARGIGVGEDDEPVLSVVADGRIGQIEIINPEDLR